ncbi:hypothetical protein P3X46_024512 [Hevea brasiliensis]|uniref:Coiled-coil domain-containing protein 47 n=1 Tax=Hevea brasiliensis TaxID=3981 RepID=A0ABQ9L482_HEVBR|nr:uncharacterized protein At5g49945 [Hevea brasiliensis]KAJ9158976.1 hypothetical protein P3X46_024512 [Hevea brasiliensis]
MTRPASFLRFLSLLSLLLLIFSPSYVAADSHFEGFEAEEDDVVEETIDHDSFKLTDLPLTRSDSPLTSVPEPTSENSELNPSSNSDSQSSKPESDQSKPSSPPSTTSFDYWDEDEFEGLPVHQPPPETPKAMESTFHADNQSTDPKPNTFLKKQQSYTVEIVCVSFLIMFIINYFTGKRENENLALSWAAKFATKDSIFEKNFSLLGVGEGDDSPLLLKEGQNVFKFYASGRRYCQGLLATMELKSRHDLIARIYNMIVPCKDEITFEVYMNDDAMDHVVFALAKKKAAKGMQKEVRDLQRFAVIVAQPPSGRRWVSEELGVISESKEVAGDLITETVLEQVFGEKAFEKFGKGFISMHFSDQHPGTHKKMLLFKFALPDANNMADMTRLIALVPYYIDVIGRYKLSSQARSKTEAARSKAAQEVYKELQNARQEALQKKKAERKKMQEEAEAKLSAEAVRKKEAKERARQMKKGMPKIKMNRAH